MQTNIQSLVDKAIKRAGKDKLIAVKIGSKAHLELIRRGYRSHHADGSVDFVTKEIR